MYPPLGIAALGILNISLYDELFLDLGIGGAQMCVANPESIAYFSYLARNATGEEVSLSKMNHNSGIGKAKAANLPCVRCSPVEDRRQPSYVQGLLSVAPLNRAVKLCRV